MGTTSVETSGTSTPVDLPDADLHLLNAADLTFAAVRPDQASVRVLLDRAADLPEAVDRALAVVTGFQMLADGELTADELFDCVLDVLAREQSPAVVEPFLNVALEIAQRWSAADRIADRARTARRAWRPPSPTTPTSTTPALRTLAAAASSPEHLARLDEAARSDVDLAWRVATRRAALGQYDEETVEALLARDPDPDAGVRALAVRTARPEYRGQGRGLGRAVREAEHPGRHDARGHGPGVLAARSRRTCCCRTPTGSSTRSRPSPAAECSRCSG